MPFFVTAADGKTLFPGRYYSPLSLAGEGGTQYTVIHSLPYLALLQDLLRVRQVVKKWTSVYHRTNPLGKEKFYDETMENCSGVNFQTERAPSAATGLPATLALASGVKARANN